MPEPTALVLKAIAGQFERGGIEDLVARWCLNVKQSAVQAGGFDELLASHHQGSPRI